MKKNILIFNQSAELYGADRAILELIENFPKEYSPIIVLHENGPLKARLEKQNFQIINASVIKVKRGIIKPLYLLQLPFEIIKSLFTIKKSLNGKKIDIVHSNATSVFMGAFYSFIFRIPHVWHVHEIIERPRKLALIYPRLINFFADRVVFNSNATSKHFLTIYPKIATKSILVYNGLERKRQFLTEDEAESFRKTHFNYTKNNTIISLIGRISEIKGQKILVKAFHLIYEKFPNSRLLFIGSYVAGKNQYYLELQQLIKDLSLVDRIKFVDFQEDIWSFYDASDIVVMPSTEPESFGLVAAEGLLSKKIVIASRVGALPEIIKDNETGLLFEVNNHEELAQKMEMAITGDYNFLGINGHNHVLKNFSTANFSKQISSIYADLTNN